MRIGKCLPMDCLVDWKVLVRIWWGRVVVRPTGMWWVQSIFVCVLFFPVVSRKQMPSLSLLSSMSIADSPGEAPVSVGTASWHALILRCRITLLKKPKFLQPNLTRRCRNKDNRNSGSRKVERGKRTAKLTKLSLPIRACVQ
jgi:hypothetical protein